MTAKLIVLISLAIVCFRNISAEVRTTTTTQLKDSIVKPQDIPYPKILDFKHATNPQHVMPNGASCLLKPTPDQDEDNNNSNSNSYLEDDNNLGSFRQISPNSAQIITKSSSSYVSYQKFFHSICNWTSNLDTKTSSTQARPYAYWVLDLKRAALVAKFAYYEISDYTDVSLHEARLSSPIFTPIPAYHSMLNSRYRGSCKIRFMSYITIPAHLDLHLVSVTDPIDSHQETASEQSENEEQNQDQDQPKPRVIVASKPKKLRSYLIKRFMEGKNPSGKKIASDEGEQAAWVSNEIPMPYNMNYYYFLEFSTMPGAITSAAARQHPYLNGVAIANFSLTPQCFSIDVDQDELQRSKQQQEQQEQQKYTKHTIDSSSRAGRSSIIEFIKRNFTMILSIFVMITILISIKFILCSYLPHNKHYVVGPVGKTPTTSLNPEALLDINNPNHRGLSPLGNILDCELKENPNYETIGNQHLESDSSRLNDYKISRKRLTLISLLGKGAFGEVYKGRLICSSGGTSSSTDDDGDYLNVLVETEDDETNDAHSIEVAVKTLTDERMSEKDFLIEATNMSKVKHPNIVQFFGVCFDEKSLYIVMEYMDGGNLKNFLIKNRSPIPPVKLCMGDLLVFALDISRACAYLQKKLFIHRDLAIRNCLLTRGQKVSEEFDSFPFPAPDHNNNNLNEPLTPNDSYLNGYNNSSIVAKLSDFGLTRDVHYTDCYRVGRKEMPVRWIAPECLDGVVTTKSDVWSYGVFLWELFSMGQQPYQDLRDNKDVVCFLNSRRFVKPPVITNSSYTATTDFFESMDIEQATQSPPPPPLPPPLPSPHYNTPQAIYDIMCSCWASDPENRPLFEDISERLFSCLQLQDVLNVSLPCSKT